MDAANINGNQYPSDHVDDWYDAKRAQSKIYEQRSEERYGRNVVFVREFFPATKKVTNRKAEIHQTEQAARYECRPDGQFDQRMDIRQHDLTVITNHGNRCR